MRDETQAIQQPKNQYFHIMLNMADDELDPYEYRLLGHYIRVGVTFESVRTTAEKTKMSVGMVVKTRNRLEQKGYIRLEAPENANDTITVRVIDRMQENVSKYAERSPHEQPVHHMNAECSPHEPKKNTTKKNQEEEKIADKPQEISHEVPKATVRAKTDADLLGNALGIEAKSDRDWKLLGKIARELKDAGIESPEYPAYLTWVKAQSKAQGNWTVTPHSLTSALRPSTYLSSKNTLKPKTYTPSNLTQRRLPANIALLEGVTA
jgi:DNA-binding MarR family transcriptional regulator